MMNPPQSHTIVAAGLLLRRILFWCAGALALAIGLVVWLLITLGAR